MQDICTDDEHTTEKKVDGKEPNQHQSQNTLPSGLQTWMQKEQEKFDNSKRGKLFTEMKKQTNEQTDALKKEVLPEFSNRDIVSVVNEIQNMKFDYEPEGRKLGKKLLTSFKERDWSGIFESLKGLFSTLFGSKSLIKTKKGWNSAMGLVSQKMTDKDIDGLITLCKKESETGKKNMYARMIAEKKDAECEQYAQTDPQKTLDLLSFHAKNGWIGVGDVINFAGESESMTGNAKEAGIQTIVGSDWTHSAIITNIDPIMITHASSQGVNAMPLIDYLKDYKNITYSIVQGGGTIVAQYAKAQIGKKYDTQNGVKGQFGDDNQQFCSELTIRALGAAGKLPHDLKTLEEHGQVYPHHIFDLAYPKYVSEYPKTINSAQTVHYY